MATMDVQMEGALWLAQALDAWAWRTERRAWAKVADKPVGWTDARGNVLRERGPGYYIAATLSGEEVAVWAPTPYL